MKDRSFNSTFATQLWNIMQTKKTNLCLSLDSMNNIVPTLESVGDYICLLKLHCDISDSISSDDISSNENTLPYIIHRISRDKNFLILDDRKYADIGHIASRQLSYCPLINVDSCTVHSIFGQSTISGLKRHPTKKPDACFLIAQSSAKDNLIDTTYTQRTYKLDQDNAQFVAGFITQKSLGDDSFLYLTPGVSSVSTNDGCGQQYRGVTDAVIRDKCDIIIVGRGIYEANDIVSTAKEYQKLGWDALMKRY